MATKGITTLSSAVRTEDQAPKVADSIKKGGNTNTSKAATAGAKYGGGEAGSALGGLVGPPIVGGIIGGIVGDKVGGKVFVKTGLDEKAAEGGERLAGVIGRRNVNIAGDMVLNVLGAAEEEECVCCPCFTASQILLFITIPFFFFNMYKLGEGVSWEWGCTNAEDLPELEEEEGSGVEPTKLNATGNATEPYPCQQGFHYLVVSGAVWLSFLPFWMWGLFGNCWRQCFCCCLCNPINILATITDCIKRCCCECGEFNLCGFIWNTLCIFHVIWALTAIAWIVSDVVFVLEGDWVAPREVWGTVVASVVMDFALAGSELFHKARLWFKSAENKEDTEMAEQSEKLNVDAGLTSVNISTSDNHNIKDTESAEPLMSGEGPVLQTPHPTLSLPPIQHPTAPPQTAPPDKNNPNLYPTLPIT